MPSCLAPPGLGRHPLCPAAPPHCLQYYAALLRLPHEMPRQDKLDRIQVVISALGLEHCRDTIIGERCACGSRPPAPPPAPASWQAATEPPREVGEEACTCDLLPHTPSHLLRTTRPTHPPPVPPVSAGGFMRKGISGGERKRCSIGVELLIDPSVMLLVRRWARSQAWYCQLQGCAVRHFSEAGAFLK